MALSRPWYPGWKTSIDGVPTATTLAYGYLLAIRVPPGESHARLDYRPLNFAAGWFCGLWALWTLIQLTVRTARRRKITRTQLCVTIVLGLPIALACVFNAWYGALYSLSARSAEFAATCALALAAARVDTRKKHD